ncbi:MAG TPA: TonB-dependent receptor plug domain-containing protein, partial [Rubrivivax sp.]|nr:TonB-dependent receptor plug domain-containing protein [Rubrivivax sp.]
MHLPPLCRLLALAALTAATAQAQTAPAAGTPPTEPAPARIEIIGGRASETEERRQSTAAKIVIGREEIEKFGDATLGEVLRRLPGVTTPGAPGRGGAPRLRGLGGGYTQLLIDGQRVPPGFALDQLSPEQVERIEILRAPTAETGARAIAGTINIITREGFRRRVNELRLGTGVENGVASPNLNWLHNDSAGALTYNLSANLGLFRSESESTTETTDEDLASAAVLRRQTETSRASQRRIRLGLNSRLQWRLGDGGDMLLLTPGVFHTENASSRRSVLRQDIGATPPPYDLAGTEADSRFTSLRLNGQLRKALSAGPRLELDGGIGSWRAAGNSLRQEYAQGHPAPLRTLEDDNQTREQAGNLTLKLSGLLGGESRTSTEHNLVAGVELAGVRREEQRRTLQDGLPLLTEFGD